MFICTTHLFIPTRFLANDWREEPAIGFLLLRVYSVSRV